MNELFARQAAVLRRCVSDYREGALALNTLIQRIEGIIDVLGIDTLKNAAFPIILSMEQVNAAALNAKTGLTVAEKASVKNSLIELEMLISHSETE